jgi:hypothetical protein
MPEIRRLDGWKEIAGYLGVSERTARRWEINEGLPISRHVHEERGTVFSTSEALDAWRAGRLKITAARQDVVPAKPVSRRWLYLAAAALLAGLGLYQWRMIGHWWIGPIRFQNITTITTDAGVEGDGDWSPDGGLYAYTADTGGKWRLYIRKLEDASGVEQPLPEGAVIGPVWSGDGKRRPPPLPVRQFRLRLMPGRESFAAIGSASPKVFRAARKIGNGLRRTFRFGGYRQPD